MGKSHLLIIGVVAAVTVIAGFQVKRESVLGEETEIPSSPTPVVSTLPTFPTPTPTPTPTPNPSPTPTPTVRPRATPTTPIVSPSPLSTPAPIGSSPTPTIAGVSAQANIVQTRQLIASPSPSLTPSPTPLAVVPYTSQQINELINRFGGQYGVDPNIIRHVALCESGFNPAARNLIYGGLFQFSSSTWISFRNLMGEDTNAELRFNAEEAVQTAAYAISKGKGHIWPNCYP